MKSLTQSTAKASITILCLIIGSFVISGCNSSETISSNSNMETNIQVGSKLYSKDGQLWGTVMAVSDAHTFENGVTEPGVQVDYGARIADPTVGPQWLPSRSAEKFDVR